jgi:hypothetical protein
MKPFAFRAFGMVLLLSSSQVDADTLVGQNGDRLAGRFIEEKDGKIVFISDLLGRLEIASDQVRVEYDPDDERPLSPSTQATQSAQSSQSSQSSPLVEAATTPHWSMDLGVKINLDRGSLKTSEDRLDARLTSTRQTARGELHGNLWYKYKATEGEVRDNDWLGSLAYDRFVSPRRFNAGRLTLGSELVDGGYDSTGALSVATGWRLWETPKHFLRIGPALGYLSITRGDQGFKGGSVGLYARGLAPLMGKARLTGELQYLDTLGNGRYGTVAVRVTHPLTERLFVSLGWDYVWSDFDIESGISSQWRWDLGWRFGPAETD